MTEAFSSVLFSAARSAKSLTVSPVSLSIPGRAEAILCSKREISAATGSPFFLHEMRSTASMVRRLKPMMMIPVFTSFSRYPL